MASGSLGDSARRAGLATMAGAPAIGLQAAWRPAVLLFRGNVRARRRRAWAGYLWLIAPGIALAAAFSLLRQGALFATGTIAIPYPVFALSGIFLWQCFTDGLSGPLQTLNRERHFLAVTPAPQAAIVLAGVLENLLALGVRMALLLAVLVVFGLSPHGRWLFVPLAAVMMLGLGLCLGLLVAPVGQLYDDMTSLIGLVQGFGLFFLPVIFPVPATSVLAWNPLVTVIDAAHAWIAGAAAMRFPLTAAGLIAVLLPAGWHTVARARPHIAARAA